jgi:hypothetical protein
MIAFLVTLLSLIVAAVIVWCAIAVNPPGDDR